MSSNEAIVLQANFTQWRARANGRIGMDPWVYFCIEQFVKPHDLNDEEIQGRYTEGGHDGGADAIFFIINYRIAVCEETTIDPRAVTSARVIFFQVKESDGFKPTEIDKHIELARDFFNFATTPESLSFRYKNNVVRKMQLFRDVYLRSSGNNVKVDVDFFYATGADSFQMNTLKILPIA
jgi:hypothetical protein